MPTSFESMHQETRPLALLDPQPARQASPLVTLLAALVSILVPLLIVVLL
jgi:hypothetical protein